MPKVLLGHVGRDPWAGHCSVWRAGNAAREILCCSSTEHAGPKATHLMESSCRDWDRRRVLNTWLQSCSSPVSHPSGAAPADSAFKIFKDRRRYKALELDTI